MKNKNKIEKKVETTIEEVHFKVDPKFRDPLLGESIFEEIDVEEYSSYYGIHLGVPLHHEQS